jgi:hypothetical protein
MFSERALTTLAQSSVPAHYPPRPLPSAEADQRQAVVF